MTISWYVHIDFERRMRSDDLNILQKVEKELAQVIDDGFAAKFKF